MPYRHENVIDAERHRCLHTRVDGEPGRVRVNGVRVDPISPRALVSTADGFLRCGESHVVHFLSAHPAVLARRHPSYRDLLNRGDLNVPDGFGVVAAMRLFGERTERVTGSDAFDLLCDWGLHRGVRHYLYGGTPDVVERLRGRLEAKHPGICLVGAESPPFRPLGDEDLDGSSEKMRRAGADLVWVGLGVPKQDLVAERLRQRESAPVVLCVGAAFDFVSGTKRRAPRWMQTAGLEWAHRLSTEPKRLWRRYLVGNPSFIAGVAGDYVRATRTRSRSTRPCR